MFIFVLLFMYIMLSFNIKLSYFLLYSFQFNTNPVHSLSVQVKLLMEIPEKIWTSIETEDYVKATQLFIMARHVNTGKFKVGKPF